MTKNIQTNITSIQPRNPLPPSLTPSVHPIQPPKFLKSKDNVASDKMALDVSEPQLQTSTTRIMVDGKKTHPIGRFGSFIQLKKPILMDGNGETPIFHVKKNGSSSN